MKTSSAFIYGIFILLLYACTSEDPVTLPEVTTDNIEQYKPTKVYIYSTLSSDGHSPVTSTGAVLSTQPGAELSTSKTIDSGETDLGSFGTYIEDLLPGTTYYVRAYATNKLGTTYGKEMSFLAIPDGAPQIFTSAFITFSYTTAKVSYSIDEPGTAKILEQGLAYSKKDNPTVDDGKVVNATERTSFTAELSGLTGGTKYYARGYTITRSGVTYGNTVNFTTLAYVFPTVQTFDPTAVTVNSSQVKINVVSSGSLPVTERGVVYGKTSAPTVTTGIKVASGSGLGNATVNVTGLQENTIYYARAYATGDGGTSYGNEIVFQTFTSALPTRYLGVYRDLSGSIVYRLSGYREVIRENVGAYLYDATNSILAVSGGYEVKAQRIGWSPVIWYLSLAADNNALSIGSVDAATRTVYKVVARQLQEVYFGSGKAGIFWTDYLTWEEKDDQGVELNYTYTETNRTDWSVYLTRSDGVLYRIDVNTKTVYRAASSGSAYVLLYNITQMY